MPELRRPPWRELWPILLWCGLPVALLWGVLAWDLDRQHRRDWDAARQRMTTVAQLGASELQTRIFTADLALLELREQWLKDPAGLPDRVRQIKSYQMPGLDARISILGATGGLLFNSHPLAGQAPADGAVPAYFTVHQGAPDHLHFSQPGRTAMGPGERLVFTRPLHSQDGRFAGVVVMALPAAFISSPFTALREGPDSVLTLMRADGIVLWRLQNKGTDTGPVSASPMTATPVYPTATLPATGMAVRASPIDGVERMSTWQKLQRYPLTLFVSQSRVEILSDYHALRRNYVIGGALSSFVLLAAAYWLLMARRIRELARQRQATDLADLRQSQLKLSEARDALQALTARQFDLIEAQRKHMAQEIHDELGQRLVVLRMDLATLVRDVRADPLALLPARVTWLKQHLDDIFSLVRDIASRLRPPAPDMGLVEATESLIAVFQRRLAIPCEFDNQLPASLTLDDLRTAAFRILQAALTNIALHARARSIRVTLATDGAQLFLTIADDGIGFDDDAASRTASLGLSGMRERAAAAGGSTTITSRRNQGTTVQVRLPLHAQNI